MRYFRFPIVNLRGRILLAMLTLVLIGFGSSMKILEVYFNEEKTKYRRGRLERKERAIAAHLSRELERNIDDLDSGKDALSVFGSELSAIADNVAIKVPLTFDGLRACKVFSDDGIMVNVTLCFSAAQAILAAKSGASFISPFIGRLDDIGSDGMSLISEITEIYEIYGFETKVLAASIRSVQDIINVAKLGADVATIPPKFLKAMYNHPLTDKGLADFLSDWKKTGQSIL